MTSRFNPIQSFLISLMAFTGLGFIVVGLLIARRNAHYGWGIVGWSSAILVVAIIWMVAQRYRRTKGERLFAENAQESSLVTPPSALEKAVWSSDDDGLVPLRALLASGEHDVNQTTSEGNSLIAYAADYAPVDTVQCLLEAGADPNASSSGELAVIAAVLSEDSLSLGWLLAFGADPLRQDADGDSAFSLAMGVDPAAEMLVLMLLRLEEAIRHECLLKIQAHDAILARRVGSGLALSLRAGVKERSHP